MTPALAVRATRFAPGALDGDGAERAAALGLADFGGVGALITDDIGDVDVAAPEGDDDGLGRLGVTVEVDGRVVSEAHARHHPLDALAWLANECPWGVGAGQRVLTGSVGGAAAVPLFDGAEVRADFGVLGEVCLSVDE